MLRALVRAALEGLGGALLAAEHRRNAVLCGLCGHTRADHCGCGKHCLHTSGPHPRGAGRLLDCTSCTGFTPAAA